MPTLPSSCRNLFHGTSRERPLPLRRWSAPARCAAAHRADGLRRVQAARPNGERCGTGVDTLAAYTRQEAIEKTRPECAGYCSQAHQWAPR